MYFARQCSLRTAMSPLRCGRDSGASHASFVACVEGGLACAAYALVSSVSRAIIDTAMWDLAAGCWETSNPSWSETAGRPYEVRRMEANPWRT